MALKERNIAIQSIIIIAAWACFFMLPFLYSPYLHSRPPLQSPRFIFLFVTSNALLIIFYYLNSKILFPKILARRKIFYYVLLILAFLFFYLTILYLIDANSFETKQFLLTDYAIKHNYKGPNYFSAGPMTQFLIALIVSSGSKLLNSMVFCGRSKRRGYKATVANGIIFIKIPG